MKKILSTVMICSLLLLGGCQANRNTENSSSNDSSIQKVSNSNQLGKTTVVDGIELTVSDLQSKPVSSEKKKTVLYSVEVKGKNISSISKGLGAIDFQITSQDGKKHKISTNYNTFGTELNPNKTISGKAYFELNKNSKVNKLEYIPDGKTLMYWNLK